MSELFRRASGNHFFLRAFAPSREFALCHSEGGCAQRRKRTRGALLALALLPVPAFAQSGVVFADVKQDDDIIVTATGVRQDKQQSGQAVTVLTKSMIDQRQSIAVADLLATTSGVTVSRNGGPGQPTAVRIRGAEGDQTLVLIDGVRANDPSVTGGGFDFGNLLTGNIERIEVLRGPNSVPWGSQALGGVVNIVTARPAEGFAARASAESGSRNTARVTGLVQGGAGPVRASLGGGYTTDDGVSAFRFGTEADGFRQYAAHGRLEVDVTSDVTIDLRGNYADSRAGFDGFPPPLFAFADTSAFSTTKQGFGYAGINAGLFDGRLTNRLAFTISDTRRASYNSATAVPSRFIGRSERFEYQGDARITDALRTVFGVERETSRFNDGTSTFTTGVTSGYVQAIVNATDALTLTAGVRIDGHRDYGTKTTVSANAAWQVGRGTLVRASYGEGFKSPTLFQLRSNFGNKDLKPETAQSYDLGIEQSLIEGTLSFGATLFHRDTTNQIDFASVPPRADRPFGYYLNVARTRAQGVEVFVTLRPTQTLTLDANYTLTDATNRATGLTLFRRPRHSVNASIDWSPRSGWSIGADIRTVSDSRDASYLTFAPISLDGYTLATLRASVAIGSHLTLFGRVENLFDAQYETVSGYGTERRTARIGIRAAL